MMDVTAIGELLIDFTESGTSQGGQRLFEQNPGGAPANFLTALSRLGAKTAFIGKVGDDLHGHFLKEVLLKEGIDCKGLIIDPEAFTTLAFVALAPTGERHFSFARKPGADTLLKPSEVDETMIRGSRVFHFGSLSLTDEPSRSSVWKALEVARASNVTISYDPNYRPLLWESEATAVTQMKSVLHMVDLMKVSDEEAILLTGHTNFEEAAKALLALGPKVVVITKGEAGAQLFTSNISVDVNGFKSECVDTTGAGDCFWGNFIYQFIQCDKPIGDISADEFNSFLRYANGAASLCVEQRGGIPGMPTIGAIEGRLEQKR